MTFNVNHIGMLPGIYQARVDARITNHSGIPYCAATYDIRLRAPYAEPLLEIKTLHTLEHVLSVALRQCQTSDKSVEVIYEGAMACQTGLYFIFFGPSQLVLDPKYIGTHISLAAAYALNEMTEIPAHSKQRCGNVYSLLDSIDGISKELHQLKAMADLITEHNEFDRYNMIEEG